MRWCGIVASHVDFKYNAAMCERFTSILTLVIFAILTKQRSDYGTNVHEKRHVRNAWNSLTLNLRPGRY